MRPFSLSLAAMCIVVFGLQTANAEPAYLDDRSSPEMLIKSLYNAINRKEYARAYSYFDEAPAKTLDAYTEGYTDTETVEVVTGTATEEGAAGSIYYALPVAISARDTNGDEKMYGGCYTFRFIQPSVQTTPYQPLMIESGSLKEGEPAEGALEDLLPASCGEGEASSVDPRMQKAQRVFDAAFGELCTVDDGIGPAEEPESYAIQASDSSAEARLFRFLCYRGAYTEGHVYILNDEQGEFLPLNFAVPDLSITYEDPDTQEHVEDIRIIGYKAEYSLADSFFDPDDLTITSHAKWRGVGDMSSTGKWLYRKGAFSLVLYDVDASADGEINPETVVDYFTGP